MIGRTRCHPKTTCSIVPITAVAAIILINFICISFCDGGSPESNLEGNNVTTRPPYIFGADQIPQQISTTTPFPFRNFTIVQPTKNSNPLKSRFKKPNLVLTLDLRPKGILRTTTTEKSKGGAETASASSIDLITSRINNLTQSSFNIPINNSGKKPYTILERLRKLTNSKMRKSTGTDFGYKNSPLDDNEEDSASESNEKKEDEDDKSFTTKVGGHLSNITPNPEFKSRPTLTLVIQPTTTTPSSDSEDKSAAGSEEQDNIQQEETRYITADQIGGNRPTSQPFHFTTTTTTKTTQGTVRQTLRPIKRYRKPHSPHNHVYSPTQDPISTISHHEDDLSVQDVQDYRLAHLAFGSKVNPSGVASAPEKPTVPTTPPKQEIPTTRPSVYRTLPFRSRSPPSRKTTVIPLSASSGVNSHIKIKQSDPSSDNLPFYKEPGGVFEGHKYPDNDNEPNELNSRFDNRAPAIKYAPKGPSDHQPQQQITYNNRNQNPRNRHQQQQQHYAPPVTPPQYVTVTQQPPPIYLAPVPVQQVHHTGQYNAYPTHNHPPPQQNYYPQQQQPPQQQPYYPAPQPIHAPPQQHHHQPYHHNQQPPLYSPAPPVRHTTPTYHQQHHQHQLPYNNNHHPTPAQPVFLHTPNGPGQNRNRYQNQRPTTTGYSNDPYNPPPDRHDPASDYYYGDPRPPKIKQATSPPAPPASRPRKSKVQDKEEEEEEEEEEEPVKPKSSGRKNSNSGRERSRPRGKNDKHDDAEEEEEEEDEKPPRPSRNNIQRNDNNGYDNDGDYGPGSGNGRGSSGNNRGRNSPRRQNSRRPSGYEDYDSDPNENIGEFVKPSAGPGQHDGRRPSNQDQDGFGNLDDNFFGREQPINPSERDVKFRPSPPDNTHANFEHPNIEYPGRRPGPPQQQQQQRNNQQQQPERPLKRQGDYDDNGNLYNTRLPPLDPIYTRTLQQYDEENTAPRGGDNREIKPNEDYPSPPYEVNEDFPPADFRERPREARPRPPPSPPPREEEEQEEDDDHGPPPQEERGHGRGRSQGQRDRRPSPPPAEEEEEEEEEPEREREPEPAQNEDEPEEEEEEEPEKRPPREREEQKPQEDEEEEEEEEQPQEQEEEDDDNKNRRKSKRQPNEKEEKKPPPEKPKQEKSGNLDDDISGIEKEFGYIVPYLGSGGLGSR